MRQVIEKMRLLAKMLERDLWRVERTLPPRTPVKPVTRIVGAIENRIQVYGYRLVKIRT